MPEVPSLGARGGGWVVLQFVLIGAIMVAMVTGPPWPGSVAGLLRAVGVVLAVVGGVLAAVSSRQLGRALTPFPRPTAQGQLVERGPYRLVRHPVYSSGVVVFTGFALALSPLALVLTALLAVVWGLKVRVEERFLRAAYPEYDAYAARTRYRLVPFVY